MGSEDTILTNRPQSQQGSKIYEQPSVKDILVPEFVPEYHDVNQWNYLNEDVFQYEDSF